MPPWPEFQQHWGLKRKGTSFEKSLRTEARPYVEQRSSDHAEGPGARECVSSPDDIIISIDMFNAAFDVEKEFPY